jgi:hypothetical protein
MALAQFEQNIDRARHLVELEASLGAIVTGVMDLSDLLRAALVQGVSALDHFVHETVREGMLEILDGSRPLTPAYEAFVVPMRVVNTALGAPGRPDWLEDAVRMSHGWQSFQHPDKIRDAMKLISPMKLWPEVADHLGMDTKSVKTKLELIVDRRNKIAHEADMDPTYPGTRWPIDQAMVTDALEFLVSVATAIDSRT